MTAAPDGYTPAYTLDNQWRAALERLQALEACCDPTTEERLDKVGVGPGWHCLEVGAGAGSVTRMLCRRVGDEGRVVAVDLEPTLLDGMAASNLEVRRLDVVAEQLPEAEFDLIHTRAVLLHLPQRDAVLAKLVRALRPGGTILLEEMDVTPAFEGPDSIFRRAARVAWAQMTATGGDIYWGAKMTAALEGAGLVDIGESHHVATFTGASTMAEFHRMTFAQLLETKPFSDEDRATIEAARAELARPGGEYVAWDLPAAWGRRP
jgi:SAM-dependent methyltransferase